jgi:hypothetical protein
MTALMAADEIAQPDNLPDPGPEPAASDLRLEAIERSRYRGGSWGGWVIRME